MSETPANSGTASVYPNPRANLDLWHSVEKTDPKAVKKITGKPYDGSSPSPHWLIKRATETFGPCGIGWGFIVLNERIEVGAEPCDKQSIALVRVWFNWKGTRGEVEHVGGTVFSGKRKKDGALFSDEDAPKKSVTDALVKALSLLGFAGDIFSGRWDDSKYQAELREEFSPHRQEPPAERTPSEPMASEEQIFSIGDELKRTGRSPTRLLKHYGVKEPKYLTQAQAVDALAILKAAPNEVEVARAADDAREAVA